MKQIGLQAANGLQGNLFSATSDYKILRRPKLCEETVEIEIAFTDI
jgi:hypothetical protein